MLDKKDYLMLEIEKNYANEKLGTNTLISIKNYLKVMFFNAKEDRFFVEKSMHYTEALICMNLIKNGSFSWEDLYKQSETSYDLKSDFDKYKAELSVDSNMEDLIKDFDTYGLNNTFTSIIELAHQYITLYSKNNE